MRFLLCVFAFLVSGCAGLLVHQDDPVSVAAAKTIWRTVLGVSTLGFSELRMSALRDTANAEALADQRLQDYEWHLTYLVNNGALTQSEAEDLYQKYAALVWQDTLDIAGGMEPVGLYSSFGSSSYGAVPWVRSPLYGPFSRSGFAASLDPFSQTSASVSPWKSRNSFARISGLARSRANSARWSPYLGWSKGSYFRSGGSKGSGRRGGRR